MPEIKIGDTPYKDYQSFAKDMQLEFPGLGLQLNNRLYRIVGAAFGIPTRKLTDLETDALNDLKQEPVFDSWAGFADFLYGRKLIAARPTGFVPHRPRNLGSRPPWIRPINDMRPTGEGLAIRHIVPSHLLGYAVENATGSIRDDIGKLAVAYSASYKRWKKEVPKIEDLFAGAKPKMRLGEKAKELTARRWAWALLYNHPGNLWVGNADDNQVIGFMYATVYGTLSRMRKVLGEDSVPHNTVFSSPTKKTVIKTPAKNLQNAVDEALKILKPFEPKDPLDLREEIGQVLSGIAKSDDVAAHS